MLAPYTATGHNLGLDQRYRMMQAVIKTLAYSMIFNYPLTAREIEQYLVAELQIDDSIQQLLDDQRIKREGKYYYLAGFECSVVQREKRKSIATAKRAVLKRFLALAKYIPTISLIGISGALAMENAHKEDDIDLLIVTRTGTVWLTRFLCILLAEGLGQRRRPSATDVRNKLCLNMFIDEAHLAIPTTERDLFSAHEVVQLKPVYNKEHTYEKFLVENSWVREFLPNAVNSHNSFTHSWSGTPTPGVGFALVRFAEQVARFFQRIYMYRRVTNEVLKSGYLRFHPSDARRFVFGRYEQILQKAVIL